MTKRKDGSRRGRKASEAVGRNSGGKRLKGRTNASGDSAQPPSPAPTAKRLRPRAKPGQQSVATKVGDASKLAVTPGRVQAAAAKRAQIDATKALNRMRALDSALKHSNAKGEALEQELTNAHEAAQHAKEEVQALQLHVGNTLELEAALKRAQEQDRALRHAGAKADARLARDEARQVSEASAKSQESLRVEALRPHKHTCPICPDARMEPQTWALGTALVCRVCKRILVDQDLLSRLNSDSLAFVGH